LTPCLDLLYLLFTEIYDLCVDNKPHEAAMKARQLLLEDGLDSFRQANLHNLIANSTHDLDEALEHAKEAAAIYAQLSFDETLDEATRSELSLYRLAAKARLGDFRRLVKNRQIRFADYLFYYP
jgi:hypothetical protein